MAVVSVCGRTFPDLFPAMRAETLPTFLEAWCRGKFLSLPKDGAIAESASPKPETGSSNGGCWTLNTSERPRNAEGACSLYSILEHGGVDRRFYLSARACRGILSRAERHGKVLPDVLMTALTRIAQGGSTTSSEHPSPSEMKTMTSDDLEDE